MRTFYLPLLLTFTVIMAFYVAMMIIVFALNPPMEDVRLLFGFMFGTGSVTVGGVYLLYRFRLVQRFNSLRWTMLAIIVLMFTLMFINVWVTAQLMFISTHDLILTTALLVFAGIIAVVSVLVISSTLINRIADLAKAARRLALGDMQVRLVVDGNDELADLSKTFNSMAAALQELDEQKRAVEQTRRNLIAWVSHDLRTPLAAVRAMNEAILDGVVSDAETIARYNTNIQREVQHLSRLIDDLFELVQLDTGHPRIVYELTSLRDLISDTIGSISARAKQRGVIIQCEVDSGIDPVYIAPDKIQRVLSNLLDNALHHTPNDGQIMLSAQRVDRELCVSVYNSGSCIAPEDLPHIFKSFYRGERSRTQDTNGYRGTGLGLAIAKGFAEAHGGTLSVSSQPEHGTTFTLVIPQSQH
jgi:signal transduction histidine kinase